MTQNATNLPDKVLRKMESRGFNLYPQPATTLPPIQDITRCPDQELGQLLTVYTAWFSYATGQLALAEVDEMASRHLMDRVSAEALVKAGGKTVTEKRLNTDLNEEVAKLKKQLLECKSYTMVLEAYVEGLEKQLALISREITRRSRVESWETREGNVQHMRR